MASQAEQRIRVLAVVHNRILREGVRCLVESQVDDLEIADAVATAEDALLRFAELQPDLTLMDLDLPCSAGLDAIHRIRQLKPDAWIIGLITDESDGRVSEAILAGASTVIAKHRIGTVEWRRSGDRECGREHLKTGVSNTSEIGMSNV